MQLTAEYLDQRLDKQFKLTKEYFDQQISKLVTKEDLEKRLAIFREDLKQDRDAAIEELAGYVRDTIDLPMTEHIAQVKSVLKLPSETKTEPIMVRERPKSPDPRQSAFWQGWIEVSKKRWKREGYSKETQARLLKRLLRPPGKYSRYTKLSSGR